MWFTIATLIGSLLLLALPVSMVIGLFSPALLSKIVKFRTFANRKQVLKEGILAFICSFILTGSSASNAPKTTPQQTEKSANSSQLVIPPTIPMTPSDSSVVSTEKVVETPIPSPSPSPIIIPTPAPTPAPTFTPAPTIIPTPTPTLLPTPRPTIITTPKPINISTPKPVVQTITPQVKTGGSWACDCSKTCPNMSCAEAQYQLNSCGCSRRDGDNDGVACDSQCQ